MNLLDSCAGLLEKTLTTVGLTGALLAIWLASLAFNFYSMHNIISPNVWTKEPKLLASKPSQLPTWIKDATLPKRFVI